jgi:prevent-host-death family protein
MKSQVTVHEAKTHLSRLIARVEAGEEIVIARRDKPAVKLVLADEAPKRPRRQFGLLRGKITIDDSFFDPLPEEELLAWEGHDYEVREDGTVVDLGPKDDI